MPKAVKRTLGWFKTIQLLSHPSKITGIARAHSHHLVHLAPGTVEDSLRPRPCTRVAIDANVPVDGGDVLRIGGGASEAAAHMHPEHNEWVITARENLCVANIRDDCDSACQSSKL